MFVNSPCVLFEKQITGILYPPYIQYIYIPESHKYFMVAWKLRKSADSWVKHSLTLDNAWASPFGKLGIRLPNKKNKIHQNITIWGCAKNNISPNSHCVSQKIIRWIHRFSVTRFFCHTQALAGGGGGDEAPPESGWMVGALQKIRGNTVLGMQNSHNP